MNASGNRSCDEKGKVAEAGRTELIQAASTTVLAGVRENASIQRAGCSADMARRTGPDARTNAPLGAGRRGDGEAPVHEEHAICREAGARASIRIVVALARADMSARTRP